MTTNTNASSKMFLRFDRKEHVFAAPTDAAVPEATDLRALITAAEGETQGRRPSRGFNDLQKYLTLCAEGKVGIRTITVFHSRRYCMGVKVVYSCSGNLHIANTHVSNHGYYTYNGGRMRESVLTFADDEYLCEVRTRQGDITDQITICTNKRTVSFGGTGGDPDPRDVSNTPVDLTKRVVALVGSFHGVLSRIGTVSILRNWEIIREFVLVRELVESSRASPKPRKRVKFFQNVEKEEAVLQELMKVDTGIFRHVLSFLIANVASD
mmetsp:Transcript_30567/g.44955  ORF Transcript_30567/g.44955 Transcript_30567/m.44955 type:complete len:267 (-) Transcript_30567:34-834(-)